MILTENRFPLFGIMLQVLKDRVLPAIGCRVDHTSFAPA